MADTIIQLPYTGTTSGDLLDASLLTVGANAVKRERMVIANDASTAVAVVTSSGDLRVQIQASATVIAQISGGISSALVTLSSNPVAGQVVSLSSGTVTLSSNPTIVSASSGFVQVYQTTSPWAVGGVVALSSGIVTLSSVIGISSGLVTLSSNPVAGQIVSLSSGTVTLSSATSLSSGIVNTLTSGVYLVNATSTGGLLVDVTRGVSLVCFNLTATSSGLKSIVSASGSNKIKLVSYVIVSNSTNDIAFYSSNTPIVGASSAPISLSSYSGISAIGDRASWVTETSAAGSLQIYLSNPGVVAGHGSYIYEV